MSLIFQFLDDLKRNNNREWFNLNKEHFLLAKQESSNIFNRVYNELLKIENLEELKEYRIYRDIRFSLDKTPYKNHFSAYFGRKKPYKRGGFYIHLEGNNCFIAGGFWGPEKDDLLRIRKSIEYSDELFMLVNDKSFKKTFNHIVGDELKTSPKGFEKNHERIELIRKKQFILKKEFKNAEVLDDSFPKKVAVIYKEMLPFFNYMSEVLTTNENGELII